MGRANHVSSSKGTAFACDGRCSCHMQAPNLAHTHTDTRHTPEEVLVRTGAVQRSWKSVVLATEQSVPLQPHPTPLNGQETH